MIRNKYLIYSDINYNRYFADDILNDNPQSFVPKNVKFLKQNFEEVKYPTLKKSLWQYKKLPKDQILIYDFEVYPNYILIGTLNIKTNEVKQYELSETKNDLWKLTNDFLFNVKLLIGHNNKGYDEILLNFIISQYMPLFKRAYNYNDVPTYDHDKERSLKNNDVIKNIYDLSKNIIESQKGIEDKLYLKYKYLGYFLNMDLMEIQKVGVKALSLKKAAINLQLPKIQELPIKPNKSLTLKDIELIKTYNIKDLQDTYAEYKFLKGEFEGFGNREDVQIRIGLYNKTKNPQYLSASKSQIAQIIFKDLYCKETGLTNQQLKELKTWRNTTELKNILNPRISFKTEQLQNVLNEIKNTKYSYSDGNKFGIYLDFDNLQYDIKGGGIHSTGLPKDLIRSQVYGNKEYNLYETDDEYIILDVDVASQYPNAILNYGICPMHLDKKAFLSVVKNIVTTRLKSKSLIYDKTLSEKERNEHKGIADSYKITANTIYGLFSAPHFWLYDPECTLRTTINNQLFMLMLIEQLHLTLGEDCICIYANTDGCSFKVKRAVYNNVIQICKNWENITNFELEYVVIKKWYIRDVNNYILQTENNKIKAKGDYDAKSHYNGLNGLNVGYSCPIIKEAVEKFLFNDVPIENTILSCNNLFDFSDVQVVSKDHKVFYETYKSGKIEQISIQNLNRYFVTKDIKGVYLMKQKEKRITKITQQKIWICNDYVENWKDLIDYDYYIQQAIRLKNGLKFKIRKDKPIKTVQSFNQLQLF